MTGPTCTEPGCTFPALSRGGLCAQCAADAGHPAAKAMHAENLALAAAKLGEDLGELPDAIAGAAHLLPKDAPESLCRLAVERIVSAWICAHPDAALRIVLAVATAETSRRALDELQRRPPRRGGRG